MATTPLDVVVYDIEIARCIPDRGQPKDPTLAYAEGWEDYAGMGIGVLCAFDTRTLDPHVYLADNLHAFQALVQGRVIVGFNSAGFDDKLLAASDVTAPPSYDVLAELRAVMGEPRVYTRGLTAAGRTLDACASLNLGATKSMSGALAPVDWQRDRRGGVIDYCLRDVMLTARLLRKAITTGMTDPVTRRTVTLPHPNA